MLRLLGVTDLPVHLRGYVEALGAGIPARPDDLLLRASERRGCEDRVLDAWSLLRRLHVGHLRPCDHRRPTQSGANNGQYPIPCCLMVSAIRFPLGSAFGSEKSSGRKQQLMQTKRPETVRFRVFLARREGFEPPAFWSVGCLKHKSEPFRLRFVLFTAARSEDFPLFPSSPARSGSVLGQKWVRREASITQTNEAGKI